MMTSYSQPITGFQALSAREYVGFLVMKCAAQDETMKSNSTGTTFGSGTFSSADVSGTVTSSLSDVTLENVSNPSASHKHTTSVTEMGSNEIQELDNSTRFELREASERTVVPKLLHSVTVSDMRSTVSESSDIDLIATFNKSSTEEETLASLLSSTESLPSSYSTQPSVNSISSERNEHSTSETDMLRTMLHSAKSTTSSSIFTTGSEMSSPHASSQPTSSNVVSTTKISSPVDDSVTTSSTGITTDLTTSTRRNGTSGAQTLPQATSTTESPITSSSTGATMDTTASVHRDIMSATTSSILLIGDEASSALPSTGAESTMWKNPSETESVASSVRMTTDSKASMDLTTMPKTESSLLTLGGGRSSTQTSQASSSDIESTTCTTFPANKPVTPAFIETTTEDSVSSVHHSSVAMTTSSISETGNKISGTSTSPQGTASITESTAQTSFPASELEASSSIGTTKDSVSSMHHSSVSMTTSSISTTGKKPSSSATSSSTEPTASSELEISSSIETIKDSMASTSHDTVLTTIGSMPTTGKKTSSVLTSTQPTTPTEFTTSISSPESGLTTTTSVETTDSTNIETVPRTTSSSTSTANETSSTIAYSRPTSSSVEPTMKFSSPADELVTASSSGITDSMTSTPPARVPPTARSTSTTVNETSSSQTSVSTEFTMWSSSPADESTTISSIGTTTDAVPKESLSITMTGIESKTETSTTQTSPQPVTTESTINASSSTDVPVTALSNGTTIGTKSTPSTYDESASTTTSSTPTTGSETSSTLTSHEATSSTEPTTNISPSTSESVTSSSFDTTSEAVLATDSTSVSLTPKAVQRCLKDLTEMEPESAVTVVFSFSPASVQGKPSDNDSYEIRIHQSILQCLAMQHQLEESGKDASKDGNVSSHLHLKRSIACVPPTFSEKGQNFSITFYVRELVNGAEKLIPANTVIEGLNSCKSMIEKEVGLNLTHIFETSKEDQAAEPSILQRHATLFIVLSAVLGIVIIIGTVAFVCFYFCRNSALYDTEKLKKDMPSSVEIGDIASDDAILNDEMAERETFELPNGCDGHFVRMQEDGWVVPISQIPIEEKNPPVVQDTKL